MYAIYAKDGSTIAKSKSLPVIRMKAVSYLKKTGQPYMLVASYRKGDILQRGSRRNPLMASTGIGNVELVDDLFYPDRPDLRGRYVWWAIGSRRDTVRLVKSDGTLGERI